MTTITHNSHIPVLLQETMDLLVGPDTKSVIDGTLGLGGHAAAIMNTYSQIERYAGFDLSEKHIRIAQERLSQHAETVSYHNANFSTYGDVYNQLPTCVSVLLDLGLCSAHIDDGERGFSFIADGPLDMRFGGTGETAAEYLERITERELLDILRVYGEVPNPQIYARYIHEATVTTTHELRDIVEKHTIPPKRRKVLTCVFQAIRMAVNEEIHHLETAIETFERMANPGDRLAIMSYHSGEDRVAKQRFKSMTKPETMATARSLHEIVSPARFRHITPKPVIPTEKEIQENPRSRSAKFRVIECITALTQ